MKRKSRPKNVQCARLWQLVWASKKKNMTIILMNILIADYPGRFQVYHIFYNTVGSCIDPSIIRRSHTWPTVLTIRYIFYPHNYSRYYWMAMSKTTNSVWLHRDQWTSIRTTSSQYWILFSVLGMIDHFIKKEAMQSICLYDSKFTTHSI